MSKIELTISPNYVPTWTYLDAVRELFQNALDQEAQNPANVMRWSYDEDTRSLTISNAHSTLSIASLLLGQTSKADDESTIGQFGEGYKIATLVLLREGKTITFHNYGAREIWRPRFVKSRRFGTDILTFFTEKLGLLETAPSDDLSIVIEGITAEEYSKIVDSNLHMRSDYEVVEATEYGEILNLPGQVFVNGLYVCTYEPYTYGYNFKPEYLKLDRDRKMVSDFNLRWIASRVWDVSKDQNKVLDMIAEGKADVAYINSVGWTTNWSKLAADKFIAKYGIGSIPVATQEELDNLPDGYTGIVVSQSYKELLTHSLRFTVARPSRRSVALNNLQEWFDNVKHKLSDEEATQFEELFEEVKTC